MYDFSKEELQILELLGQGLSESEIAQALNMPVGDYRQRWQSLANKFEWQEPQSSEGKTQALLFERARSAALMATLHATQSRLRALMELTPNGVLVIDGRTGRISQTNDQCEQLFGYSREELAGMDVEKLLDPHLHDKHVGLRLGFLKSLRKREVGYHPPIFAVRKDGTRIELIIGLTASTTSDDVMVVCTEYSQVIERESAPT